MTIKNLLIALVSLSVPGTIFAQDKIFKSNGDVLDTKIRNVGAHNIIFVRYDNQSGPEYTIPKREVDKIKYENGSEESFTGDRMTGYTEESPRERNERFKGKYKPNIVAFAPIQFTEAGIAGFSFSYERALDKNGIVAFYVPAVIEFNPNSHTAANGVTVNNTDQMSYLMPGMKIYPTGSYGVTKYAIGPSLVIGAGHKTDYYDPYYQPSYYNKESKFVFGMIVNQSININPTPHLYIGSEFGLGFTYINSRESVNQGTGVLVNFNFKLGYRF